LLATRFGDRILAVTEQRGKAMKKSLFALTALAVAALFAASGEPAMAKVKCSGMLVASEGNPKVKLCVSKRELAKARRICKGRKVIGCICQDGNTVGACGD
jgi:hypothetical protein